VQFLKTVFLKCNSLNNFKRKRVRERKIGNNKQTKKTKQKEKKKRNYPKLAVVFTINPSTNTKKSFT